MLPVHRRVPLAVAALALAALALGVSAALGAAAPPPPSVPPAVPVELPPCPAHATPKAPAGAPVPQDILDAFGVLRRDRTDADALPAAALQALRARGLEPFDPAAARLLRTTAEGGRAWVVPVRDTAVGLPMFVCPVPVVPRAVPPRQRRRAVPVPAPSALPPAPRIPSARAPKRTPHPGLAVVALGGAPAGGGGALVDLVRGRAPVAADPCGGPDRNMLTISGVVPDGVASAFLTSPDGTAVRADVKDNAYAFVIPRPKTAQQRYVVWTGGDGTPHVAPVRGGFGFVGLRVRCARPVRDVPRVTPDPLTAGCQAFGTTVFAPPVPRPRRAPVPALPAPLAVVPCAAPAFGPLVPPKARLPRRHP